MWGYTKRICAGLVFTHDGGQGLRNIFSLKMIGCVGKFYLLAGRSKEAGAVQF